MRTIFHKTMPYKCFFFLTLSEYFVLSPTVACSAFYHTASVSRVVLPIKCYSVIHDHDGARRELRPCPLFAAILLFFTNSMIGMLPDS